MAHLYTPRLDDGQRLQLWLNDEDYDKCQRRGGFAHVGKTGSYFGCVTDLVTGTQYDIYGAACEGSRVDGGCWCDARAVPVER